MAYNNGFPATYPQYFPQYNQPQMQQPQTQNNNMVWVQGETGAKSFLIAPNTTVPLWDSEQQTIYIKSSDASGMPSMKIIDYTIRDTNSHPANKIVTSDYVTKQELSDFKSEVTEMIKTETSEVIKKELGS